MADEGLSEFNPGAIQSVYVNADDNDDYLEEEKEIEAGVSTYLIPTYGLCYVMWYAHLHEYLSTYTSISLFTRETNNCDFEIEFIVMLTKLTWV